MTSSEEHDLSRMRPTWASVNLDAFASNVAAIKRLLPADSGLVAVLKADGYGHGAVELARRCRGEVAMIATALLEESIELRRAGISLPLLVLGPLRAEQVADAIAYDVTLGVPGPEELALLCEAAREREVSIHLKLDSGMGRMGVTEGELAGVVSMLRSAPRLRVAAIYTHFAGADEENDSFTGIQIATYDRMLETLRSAGITAPLHHFANSAATLRRLVRPGDLARVGIALYGISPIDANADTDQPPLSEVLNWRTEIARLKTLPKGQPVGYGKTFHTARPSVIATLPVGYADGFSRAHSNNGEVLVRGKRAPIVGRVSMDLVTVDVTDVGQVQPGDEVILIGAQGDQRITADEMASRIGTISYEVFCSIGARVPRVYRDGQLVRVRTRFIE